MNVLLWIGCFLLCIVMVICGMFVIAMAVLALEIIEDFGLWNRQEKLKALNVHSSCSPRLIR